MIDFDQAVRDPAAHFRHPMEIVSAQALSREQRMKLLRQWEYDAMQLQVATEENMPAPDSERVTLREILAALEELDAGPAGHIGGTKSG